ncbi:MAG: Uma2 family endonuclease [Caldilineales bacterium]|nr:Uma2 family endonuclease [Caldilineales bacterium]
MSALPHVVAPPRLSEEDYFRHEESADYRSEYRDGEIVAMAGATVNHNQIVGNLYTALRTRMERSCRVFATDLRLFVKRHGFYTYPDVMVICGRLQFAPGRMDTVTNPVLIVEVLSPSTEAYDRGRKFEFYRSLESLQEYVLVDQDRFLVEHYRRREDGTWLLTTCERPDDILHLPALGVDLPLAVIYERVEWGEGANTDL